MSLFCQCQKQCCLLVKVPLKHIIAWVPAGGAVLNKGVFCYIKHLLFSLQYVCSCWATVKERRNPSHFTKESGYLVETCCFLSCKINSVRKTSNLGPIPALLTAFTIFLALSVVTEIVVPGLSNFHSNTLSLSPSARFALVFAEHGSLCSTQGWCDGQSQLCSSH